MHQSLTNVGAQTAVNFKFVSLHPIKSENIRAIEYSLSKAGSGGGKLDNPYYFRQDDMSSDFQFRIKFTVDTEYLEKTFGALSKVGKVKLTVGATPTGRKTIEKSFECDFSSGLKHQIEERIPHRATQNLPGAIQAFNLMKRYWTGLDGTTETKK
jgi:hypothetical protein